MIHTASPAVLQSLPIRSRTPSPVLHLPRHSTSPQGRHADRSLSPPGDTSPLGSHRRSPCPRSPPLHRPHSPSNGLPHRATSPSPLHQRMPQSPVHNRSPLPSPGLSTSPKGYSSPPPHKSFSISSILSRDDPKKDVLFPETSLGLSHQDALAARSVSFFLLIIKVTLK